MRIFRFLLIFTLLTFSAVSGASAQEVNIQNLLQKAESGDVNAMFNLGYMYYKGDGVAVNFTEAMKWYMKAAEKGDAAAMRNIGAMYHNGEGVLKNSQEAIKWYMKAAEKGDAAAMYNMGVLYYNDDDMFNDKEALEWFKKAADNGDIDAMYWAGRILYYDYGGDEKYKKEAEQYLKMAAEKGNTDAILEYTIFLDEKDAEKWYQLGAEKGDSDCMYHLALRLLDKKEVEKAVGWLKKGSEGDEDLLCTQFLGDMYLHGENVVKDYKRAYELFIRAQDRGSFYATGRIGEMYYYGFYVKQDFDKAFQYLNEAATHIDLFNMLPVEAMRLLAACYRYGKGTKADPETEKYWMNEAASMGDEKAQRIMKK